MTILLVWCGETETETVERNGWSVRKGKRGKGEKKERAVSSGFRSGQCDLRW
jgi:hypothetical protein